MIAELQQVFQLSQTVWWIGLAVFIRVGAMIATLPAFGDQPVPMRVRLALTLVFTLIVAPGIATEITPTPDTFLKAFEVLGKEVITGLFFGLFLRFFILALQIAGSIAAQSTSLSQIFGGTTGVDPQPAIGHLLVVAGTALAALSGLHIQVAAYILNSYAFVPFGSGIKGQTFVEVGVSEISRTFSLGFTLAAPFLIASLVYNVILGVINRAMPQLMVSFVGAPAITAGGLLILFLASPFMLSIWNITFADFMRAPLRVWP